MIEWFESSESDVNEVPWIREYIEAGGDYDTPIDVEACFIGLKGVLVITECYKAFAFKGSKTYKNLVEALPVFVEADTGTAVLVACATNSGTLQLGLDHERNDATWKRDDKGYFQRVNSSDELKSQRLKRQTNPLMPKTPIPTKSKSSKPNSNNITPA